MAVVQSDRGRNDIRVKPGCLTCGSTAPRSTGPTLTCVCTRSILIVGGEACPGTGHPEQGQRWRAGSIPGESQCQPRAPGRSPPEARAGTEGKRPALRMWVCDLEGLRSAARPEDRVGPRRLGAGHCAPGRPSQGTKGLASRSAHRLLPAALRGTSGPGQPPSPLWTAAPSAKLRLDFRQSIFLLTRRSVEPSQSVVRLGAFPCRAGSWLLLGGPRGRPWGRVGPTSLPWLPLCRCEPQPHAQASISASPGCHLLQRRTVCLQRLQLFGMVVANASGALHGSKSTWTPCMGQRHSGLETARLSRLRRGCREGAGLARGWQAHSSRAWSQRPPTHEGDQRARLTRALGDPEEL